VTVGEALRAARERLRADGEAGSSDALRLLEDSAERTAAWILAHRDDELEPAACARYAGAVERRALGEPVAYICGSAGFYGRTFAVTPEVLVPRPESEHVVEAALAALRARAAAVLAPRVCDVGTGSGVLAVTLACEWPAAHVTALDVSAAALAVAQRNAVYHGVAGRVRFLQSDAFARVAPEERFECIVANLPYVKTAELQSRPAPTGFEPVLALDGGPDGLCVYRRFLGGAAGRLTFPGAMFLEAAPGTAAALANLVRAALPESRASIVLDYGGRERVVAVHRGTAAPNEKANQP
jgi:release factor glutamine methyltransferase